MKKFTQKATLLSLILTSGISYAQDAKADSAYVREHYEKTEQLIPMRDGTKLFTAIYTPKDQTKKYPVLLNRTPYTVAPYGADEYKKSLGNFPAEMREGFIFVYQDVRGKWMSEGEFEDVRPVNKTKNKKAIDESTDTYDTLEWLAKNMKNYNQKAGIYGISYPGFYSTMSLVNSHPTLKAVSPQAPVTNWFLGDDFHHNGVLFLNDSFKFMSSFGVKRPQPITPDKGPKSLEYPIKDNYRFYLEGGSVKELKDKYFQDNIKFYNDLFAHPDYDQFWQDRNPLPHLTNVKPAVMTVGGFFDAEDVYGAFETYKAIEKQNPNATNILVAGPWFHGGWVRSKADTFGDMQFGTPTGEYYQQQIELPFFNYYLKDKGNFKPTEAQIFITGSNEWKQFDTWPPKNVTTQKMYLQANGKISFQQTNNTSFDEYIADPNNPVPYQGGVLESRPREYMVDDQRFASTRPDVMVYQTDILTEDVTITGPIINHLFVSSTGTDADYVIKLIDVFPEDTPKYNGKLMAGYQNLIRAEIMRGKYRNSFEKPEAMVPNLKTNVTYSMPDVGHTFKKGHRIMIQVQNTWFPLADRNPQQFMNVYEATAKDFLKQTQRIYHDSYIEIPVLK
ncbi:MULTISPECIES: CocE/NonD family hydrolase [Empedobacter]|uniref:CocE/NonD family hydrolase n=1 Tax=Empedobacter TaxID=59734 RepID=UPI00244BB93B|nr:MULTISPECIES: CocE/NonD family hydrolase [Empedobacter]MDH0673640.1 CocE/NonD family hydrolase [Empedobacter sp. GD03861]MDH2206717.1 CocE/NonD family hydrolase [Empedobacter sp. GD03644]